MANLPHTQSPEPTASPASERDFTALLERHRRGLLALLRTCGAGQDAEDVLQETFERVWQYRGSCDLQRSPKAWLQKAAFRCWLDARKRAPKHPAPLGDLDQTVPARAEATTELQEQLQHALAHMTDIERDILLRFHQRGDSLGDIAQALRMNQNTVKSHLHRARRKLPRGNRP